MAARVEVDPVDEDVRRGHDPAGEDGRVVADPDVDTGACGPGDRGDHGHQVVL